MKRLRSTVLLFAVARLAGPPSVQAQDDTFI